MNQAVETTAVKPPMVIDPTCGNCCHFAKSSVEIGSGMCMALPPGCAFRGATLVKTRPTMAATERGCTALFAPLPEVLALINASLNGASNETPGIGGSG